MGPGSISYGSWSGVWNEWIIISVESPSKCSFVTTLSIATHLLIYCICFDSRNIDLERWNFFFIYSIKSLQDELPITIPTNYSTKHYKDDNTTGSNIL